ncbi:MAG TPA: VOC family protein [Acidimicrobiales bacterium]|nr:VOC family protein [Acidimicrobiales bacterium]
MIELVLDCRDPDTLARFWGAALAYEIVDASGPYRSLEPIDGADPGPALVLQAVAEPKVGKNRLHLDVYVPDVSAEAARLEDLGARRLSDEVVDEDGERWMVMADPEGNEFCVCEE